MSFRAVRKYPFRGRSSLITFWTTDREPLDHSLTDPMVRRLRVGWYPPVTNRGKPSKIITLLSNSQIFEFSRLSISLQLAYPSFNRLHTLDEWRSSEYFQIDSRMFFRVQTRLSTISRHTLSKFSSSSFFFLSLVIRL